MTPVSEAVKKILAEIGHVSQTELVEVSQALGRVLASGLISPMAVPAFANSQMDGYAGRFDDFQVDRYLPLSMRVPAGSQPEPLPAHSVARIFTGAPIPEGADTVVMQENMQLEERAGQVFAKPFKPPTTQGQFIRLPGADLQPDQSLFKPGHRLGSADIGLLASVGIQRVKVNCLPRIGLFSTGDELVQPGKTLSPGQIYDSNRPMMRAWFSQLGICVTDLGCLPDKAESTRQALAKASETHDLVLTCGGVSVGEEDHVKGAVSALGQLSLWKLAMKPGKPFAFGRMGGCYFVGLPGNPVSAWVTFFVLGQLIVRRLEGEPQPSLWKISLPAGFDWQKPDAREEFLRGSIDSQGRLQIHSRQDSHILSSLAQSQGLVRVPAGTTVKMGEPLDFFPYHF
ncbi:MAG: gephyrin-like molybdotransferase Glp [Bordetella sp.]